MRAHRALSVRHSFGAVTVRTGLCLDLPSLTKNIPHVSFSSWPGRLCSSTVSSERVTYAVRCRARRDTAGQERYSSLAPLYYRGASAAAVVYDVTSPDSFSKAKYWVSELQKNASGDIGAPCAPVVVRAR